MSKAANAVVPLWDALYILQLEEYRVLRLLKWLPRFFVRRNVARRERLQYTVRAKSILAAAVVLFAANAMAFFVLTASWPPRIVALVAMCALGHLYVAAATWLLWPLHHAAAVRLRARAARRVAAHVPPITVIAIAGSYGKTTTKHLVYQLVRHTRPTQMIPGTINTPRGIAAWILNGLQPSTEVLVVEMDAYQPGEIAQSCGITPPSIAVVTNVGDQHLERFGSAARLASALGELFARSAPAARWICDRATYEALGRPSADGHPLDLVGTGSLAYGTSNIPTDGHSASTVANLRLALAVASAIGVPERFVLDACTALELPDRRQRRATMFGYDAIDDSYNISFTTAKAGLAAGRDLAQSTGKKLLVLAAGIPELAPNEREKNRLLGALLAQQADHTAVLGSMFADELERGIGAAPHTRYADLKAFLASAHDAFPPSEWVLLQQPELNDLYY